MEDRALRRITTGLGGKLSGPRRATGFDIDAASEIMAVLALAAGYDDLRDRLSRLVAGYTSDGTPVTASDLKVVGAMMALLKDALKPNLVQTMEGQPALVHTGPFANIAHGTSSVLADRLAMACGDIVVTEAGFGADLGLEKFIHIKSRSSGVSPSAAVVVVTVRALKRHGGVDAERPTRRNEDALRRGAGNMEHAIALVKLFGLPAVEAINQFPEDTGDELDFVKRAARDSFDLLTEPAYVHVHGASIADVVMPPETLQNLVSGERSSPVGYQEREEVKFPGLQLNGSPAEPDGVARQGHFYVARFEQFPAG